MADLGLDPAQDGGALPGMGVDQREARRGDRNHVVFRRSSGGVARVISPSSTIGYPGQAGEEENRLGGDLAQFQRPLFWKTRSTRHFCSFTPESAHMSRTGPMTVSRARRSAMGSGAAGLAESGGVGHPRLIACFGHGLNCRKIYDKASIMDRYCSGEASMPHIQIDSFRQSRTAPRCRRPVPGVARCGGGDGGAAAGGYPGYGRSRPHHVVIADGNPDHAYLDISIRLRGGRSAEAR